MKFFLTIEPDNFLILIKNFFQYLNLFKDDKLLYLNLKFDFLNNKYYFNLYYLCSENVTYLYYYSKILKLKLGFYPNKSLTKLLIKNIYINNMKKLLSKEK